MSKTPTIHATWNPTAAPTWRARCADLAWSPKALTQPRVWGFLF